jgi:hypothetical protein
VLSSIFFIASAVRTGSVEIFRPQFYR